ncbi:MAG: adenosine deaminase [Chloroflexota bacterium]|nr:adenosine deaminase [Chloroflexota bacterium]MDE2920765.1 adenosine deaminase [Chloroflexota bacterium]
MSASFAEALEAGDVAAIRGAAKADLHSHLYFAAPIADVERWLGRAIDRAPHRMDGLDGMRDYSRQAIGPYMDNWTAFEFTAGAAVRHARSDGVVLLESSFDIWAVRHHPDGLRGLAAFAASLAAQFRGQVDFRPEVGFSRSYVAKDDLMTSLSEAIETGVFRSIDMYAHEDDCKPETVRWIYEKARSHGLKLKAHVGEFGGADEVKRTVEILELDEVQHGIGAAESTAVMHWLADHRVRLNVCPTSNVMLGAVADLESHPIRRLYDHGMDVTINTDDLMIFGQSVSDEYLNLYRAGVFTPEELEEIRLRSLRRQSESLT